MYMKPIWRLLSLIFLITGICSAQIPDLLGNWTATGSGYVAGDGFYTLPENILNFSITEQNGRLFMGNLTYTDNGTEAVEGFAGAIGLDNKTLYRVEFSEGYSLGTIISENEVEMIYLEDGEMGRVFIDRLHRIKA